MNEEPISNRGESDWERLANLPDEEIDLRDVAALTPEQVAALQPSEALLPGLRRPAKKRITIRLDEDVVAFFKERAEAEDDNYQSLINAALREAMLRRRGTYRLQRLIRHIVREELAAAQE